MDWFLLDRDLRHERVKRSDIQFLKNNCSISVPICKRYTPVFWILVLSRLVSRNLFPKFWRGFTIRLLLQKPSYQSLLSSILCRKVEIDNFLIETDGQRNVHLHRCIVYQVKHYQWFYGNLWFLFIVNFWLIILSKVISVRFCCCSCLRSQLFLLYTQNIII